MTKKYNIIYADPPWQFENKRTGGSMTSSAASQYTVTSTVDLMCMDVESLAADDCVLIMWYVGSMPKDAILLAEAWGFEVKNINGFVWNKKTKKGLQHFGMGYYTRAGSESALIATKGSPKVINRAVRSVIKHQVLKHSVKPDIFRQTIVEMFGDLPRLEMFARRSSPGWDLFGNEAPDSISMPVREFSKASAIKLILNSAKKIFSKKFIDFKKPSWLKSLCDLGE